MAGRLISRGIWQGGKWIYKTFLKPGPGLHRAAEGSKWDKRYRNRFIAGGAVAGSGVAGAGAGLAWGGGRSRGGRGAGWYVKYGLVGV